MDCLVSPSIQSRLIDFFYMARQFWTSSWLLVRFSLARHSASSEEQQRHMIFKLSNGTSMTSAIFEDPLAMNLIVTVDSTHPSNIDFASCRLSSIEICNWQEGMEPKLGTHMDILSIYTI
jgi:hypothetical protein